MKNSAKTAAAEKPGKSRTVKTAPLPANANEARAAKTKAKPVLVRPGTAPARPTAKAPAKATAKSAPDRAPRSLCPINLVLEAVGDNWSLLILRDLMFRGHSSYQAFLRSEEKIATNILADRLLKLEQNGLISKSADPRDARKFIYALTEKGADLAPLLVEMTLYAQRHNARVDMPKDVLTDMGRNKSAFAQRMIRNNTPKRPRTVKEAVEAPEETLSLF